MTGAVTSAAPSANEASVFFQSSPTTISVYDVILENPKALGIPTSQGGDPSAYLRAVRGYDPRLDMPVMLGLVQRQKIDDMDETTRAKFADRLVQTTSTIFAILHPHNYNDYASAVDKLSVDFNLGLVWEMQSDGWKGRSHLDWANIANDQSNSMQTRASAAVEMWPPYWDKSTSYSYFRYFRYMETLSALLKYLDVGK